MNISEKNTTTNGSSTGTFQDSRFLKFCRNCSTQTAMPENSPYAQLLRMGRDLLVAPDIDRLLSDAVDMLIGYSKAEKGIIALFGAKGELIFETARTLERADIANPELEICRCIVDEVKKTGKPLCSHNTTISEKVKQFSKFAAAPELDFICLPFVHNEVVFGLLYLEAHNSSEIFSSDKCFFIGSFADFISHAAFRALEHKQLSERVNELEMELRGKYEFEAIIGHDPKMIRILKLVSQIAATDATILIEGESGTGKELVARAIHYNSHRRDKPFVPVNCGGIPKHLLESELFGHVRGSFTGAISDKIGWFERAQGGTILLDEISEMSIDLQVRLLRVLQTGEYAKVGSTKISYCDARILAASSKRLRSLVDRGLFREEVFYRLNVIDIHLPPLRERKQDILILANHMLRYYAKKYRKPSLQLSAGAEHALMTYAFPGNVRELENAVQHAVVLAEGGLVERQHLPLNLLQESDGLTDGQSFSSFKSAKQKAVRAFESKYITDCLNVTNGNIRKAADLAGIDVKNFHMKIKQHGINALAFKKAT